MEEKLENLEVIPSLKWLLTEALSDSGRGDMFLQGILNNFLHREMDLQSRNAQEEFMVDVTKTLVLHNREVRRKLTDITKTHVSPIVKI